MPGEEKRLRKLRLGEGPARFVVLALAGCRRAGASAERSLSARRSPRHQRNALTEGPDGEPQLEARAGRPIGARAAEGVTRGTVQVFPGVQPATGTALDIS